VSDKPRTYWPNGVTMPVVLPQPVAEADRYVAGCICPSGANLACESPLCPRKNVMNIVALGPLRK
jgi:hypothetical protein